MENPTLLALQHSFVKSKNGFDYCEYNIEMLNTELHHELQKSGSEESAILRREIVLAYKEREVFRMEMEDFSKELRNFGQVVPKEDLESVVFDSEKEGDR